MFPSSFKFLFWKLFLASGATILSYTSPISLFFSHMLSQCQSWSLRSFSIWGSISPKTGLLPWGISFTETTQNCQMHVKTWHFLNGFITDPFDCLEITLHFLLVMWQSSILFNEQKHFRSAFSYFHELGQVASNYNPIHHKLVLVCILLLFSAIGLLLVAYLRDTDDFNN